MLWQCISKRVGATLAVARLRRAEKGTASVPFPGIAENYRRTSRKKDRVPIPSVIASRKAAWQSVTPAMRSIARPRWAGEMRIATGLTALAMTAVVGSRSF